MPTPAQLLDFALVVLGFSFIIFMHELGHFVAARWAGIRVHAFAIGFGQALVSYRKGLGLRLGSSEAEYQSRQRPAGHASAADVSGAISPTEYRLNWLPFGGYVKMLGQEDGNPEAISDAPDSYQSANVYKRMVVISAGVFMNILTAAGIFVAVFMIGLDKMPAKIGDVAPGSAASKAVAINAKDLGISSPGLMPGDQILTINGERPNSFDDLMLASTMARKDTPVAIEVVRPGVNKPLAFNIVPQVGRLTGLLELGVEPARSPSIIKAETPADAEEFTKSLAKIGLPGVKPGMTLKRLGAQTKPSGAADIDAAFRRSGGEAVELEFVGTEGAPASARVEPMPQMQEDLVPTGPETMTPLDHLLGLAGVMKVAGDDAKQGLKKGDVFARIGALEYPNLASGMTEIRSHARRPLDLIVLRADESGAVKEVALKVDVSRDGRIGFVAGSTAEDSTLLALPPAAVTEIRDGAKPHAVPASSAINTPGLTVVSVEGKPVSNFRELRAALVAATAPGKDATVHLTLRSPLAGEGERTVAWSLAASDVDALHTLGWRAPFSTGIFEPEMFKLWARTPAEALKMGLAETRRVMLSTYTTFARLFEGTVKVEHLRGPVGIAHIGTMIAGRGLVYLAFFLGLISVNLAVVNFLPMPITDGGQFLFLLYEAIVGRPVPIPVQNVATLVGLLGIGTMFLVVTFNDVSRLFGL